MCDDCFNDKQVVVRLIGSNGKVWKRNQSIRWEESEFRGKEGDKGG